MKTNKLTLCIMAGMLLGIAVGYACNASAPNADAAKEIAGYFNIVTDIFLRLIKMIIGPLVFATLVSGIAGMGDSKAVGRIGLKAMLWFLCASLASLFIGMLFVDVLQPGHAMNLPLPAAGAATNLKTSSLNLKDFITHVFPKSFFDAMAQNEILQILVFSVFFGFAAGSFKEQGGKTVLKFVDELGKIMLRVTDYVMWFAPAGVFAAIASVITVQGLGILITYGKFITGFYLALAVLWSVLFIGGYLVLRGRLFGLLKMIQEPTLLAFSTASSEAAYPKTLEQLKKFGVSDKISGFVLPLGYSFNLDGSMIYQAFAIIFVAQAFNIELSITKQITILLVLMITSKGMAGVARASLVVVAATLPMFNLPEAGLLLIMGIDQFLDMGRTATNVIGNSIATAVVAQWEGGLAPEGALEEGVVEEDDALLDLPVAAAE
ncbi:dicarboxylate/amino acid:cation symporter [Geomesophilobacter sediminis]|uniref:Dicarboxylate/amino acid:cation symporter n=1 Tax=Geomesophilobacter sediminis TaxID=2798584 RepID=A0A8J7LV05_9BACT|nr:dicarboxylate/amino acid:cation symporter [Geomesophilobacter sediminis]MBJ6725249.1 dicarboxylate/amino acid:cation symporter [Geomesophilobacter sediminis]